ncbi:MAG: hypothetical protein QXE31_01250 [Candidatus Woesearchaeota archaeon]
MKKIFVFFVLLFMAFYLVFGQKGVHEPGTGLTNPEIKEAGQGTGQGLQENVETETQNQGQENEIKTKNQEQVSNQQNQQTNQGNGDNQQVMERKQERIMQNQNLELSNGKKLEVQVENNEQFRLRANNVEAKTKINMMQEQTQEGVKLQVQLSNGKNAEVKVMPDTASERAIERLRLKVCSEENNCQIELKEVGSRENIRVAYEIRAEKETKLFGLFKAKMQVKAQVDAENGEVVQEFKPWWAFLAKE